MPEIDYEQIHEILKELKSRLLVDAYGYLAGYLLADYNEVTFVREIIRNPEGYIYALKAGEYVKIGRSESPDERIKTLKIQLPFKVEILNVFPCLSPVETERRLHRKFAEYRSNGEWFALREADIEKLRECAVAWPDKEKDTVSYYSCDAPLFLEARS